MLLRIIISSIILLTNQPPAIAQLPQEWYKIGSNQVSQLFINQNSIKINGNTREYITITLLNHSRLIPETTQAVYTISRLNQANCDDFTIKPLKAIMQNRSGETVKEQDLSNNPVEKVVSGTLQWSAFNYVCGSGSSNQFVTIPLPDNFCYIQFTDGRSAELPSLCNIDSQPTQPGTPNSAPPGKP